MKLLEDFDYNKDIESFKRKNRILCLVKTNGNNHETIAKHVKATWGKRCKILLFESDKQGKLGLLKNNSHVYYQDI